MADHSEMFDQNCRVIAAELKRLGFTQLKGIITGAGDSGETPEWSVEGSDDEVLKNVTVPFCLIEPKWDAESRRMKYESKTEIKPLEEAIEELLEQLPTAVGMRGFENNEGGGVQLTMDLEQGVVSTRGWYYVVAEEEQHTGALIL